MKSPITGKDMTLCKEDRVLKFRKEEFSVRYHYYHCEDTGESFTSTELDELNLQQVYNQYREKHNLPFPDDIKDIRLKYGLSAAKMSAVLGFGVNSYRNYENGEVPSHSNGKLIQLASDPVHFKNLVEISESLNGKEKDKLLRKVEKLIDQEEENFFSLEVEKYLLDGTLPSEFSGFRRSSLERLTEMVVYFTEQLKPWKTQMNKLLFYADFLSFKKTCFSLSGAQYRAIKFGPVPSNYHSVFEYMLNSSNISIKYVDFGKGHEGEQFIPNLNKKFNDELFNEFELEVLKEVAEKFKGVKTKKLIDLSHKEKAWKTNVEENNLISYKYAFDLVNI